MDKDAIADLKQFIAATVSQQISQHLDEQTAIITAVLEQKISESEQRLEKKIVGAKDEILTAVADTMQHHIEYVDGRLDNHEKRLRKLEPNPA